MKKVSFIPELLPIIKELQDAGYDIIISEYKSLVDKPHTYFTVHKEGKFAYVQYGEYECYSISTVHIPCKSAGTGYGIYDHSGVITLEMVNEAMGIVVPSWHSSNFSNIKKYPSLEYYLKNKLNIGVSRVITEIY